jgi:hypothetical protein
LIAIADALRGKSCQDRVVEMVPEAGEALYLIFPRRDFEFRVKLRRV